MQEISMNEQYKLNQDKKRLAQKVSRWAKKNEKNVMDKKVKERIAKRAEEMEKSLFKK